jgi:hypothetical protein
MDIPVHVLSPRSCLLDLGRAFLVSLNMLTLEDESGLVRENRQKFQGYYFGGPEASHSHHGHHSLVVIVQGFHCFTLLGLTLFVSPRGDYFLGIGGRRLR